MAKKKRSPNQPTLFPKRPVPQMPEGYYSSGPNPNLRRFVEEHATPYDPETDDYDVPPFDKPIKTTKATAIYNMHSYWSKKPHDAIREYIKHHTKPGDIVLDPMCGSGGTAFTALMEGRCAIAIDLSPAATFITKHYCTPVNIDILKIAFDELREKIDPEMQWLYETRCDRCDGAATIAYVVYSYLFECPRCLEKIPLFDCIEAQGLTAVGKPKNILTCPNCFSRGHTEEISTRDKRFDPKEVIISYLCEEGCTPRRDERRHNDSDPKKRAYFNNYDLAKLHEIDIKDIPYWFPKNRMMNSPASKKEWGMLWRPYHGDIQRVDQFFTKQNLWALAGIKNAIGNLNATIEIKDTLRFIFQSNILNSSIMYRFRESGKGGIAMGTYYVPPIYQSMNVYSGLKNKYSDISRGLSVLLDIRSVDLNISTQTSLDISNITNNKIDYIFTDPPYSWKVQYGESNFIWEAWGEFKTDWLSDEIIVNPIRELDEIEWQRRLRISLQECFRVLKPGRWLSLCYHDTSEGTWEFVQDIACEVGFIPENTESTIYIDAGQRSWKQLVSEKVTKRDLVINFRKPRPGELINQLTLFGDEDKSTFTQKARAIITESLEKHPGSSADRLYDELVSRMVRKREFERHNFDEILRSVAEDVNGRWYLLETADQVDETESSKETEVVAQLEAYMQQYLKENPGELGVHYSDLFEQYLPVQDKPRRLMQELLPEFFFKTEDGTWRPPSNDEELAQKEALRTSGTLRRIKRFANALLEGVPPYEKDIPANTPTAADWIRQCRRAGLYEQGRALYEKGDFTFHELGEEAQMEVEEDYQICVRRS